MKFFIDIVISYCIEGFHGNSDDTLSQQLELYTENTLSQEPMVSDDHYSECKPAKNYEGNLHELPTSKELHLARPYETPSPVGVAYSGTD